jgi:hypothetical protein
MLVSLSFWNATSASEGNTFIDMAIQELGLGLENAEAPAPASEPDENPVIPSEGGVADWLCVTRSSIGLVCTFGFLNA